MMTKKLFFNSRLIHYIYFGANGNFDESRPVRYPGQEVPGVDGAVQDPTARDGTAPGAAAAVILRDDLRLWFDNPPFFSYFLSR
jgi:hypothetical protein